MYYSLIILSTLSTGNGRVYVKQVTLRETARLIAILVPVILPLTQHGMALTPFFRRYQIASKGPIR